MSEPPLAQNGSGTGSVTGSGGGSSAKAASDSFDSNNSSITNNLTSQTLPEVLNKLPKRGSPTKTPNFNLDNIDESDMTFPKFVSPRANQITHSSNSSYSSNDYVENESLIMNYSPKHSRKPSSLSSNRNINMKNLSLNLDDNSSNSEAGVKKNLAICIPTDEASTPKSPFIRSNSSSETYTPNGTHHSTTLLQQQPSPQIPLSASTSTFKLSPIKPKSQATSQSQPQSPVKKISQMQNIKTTLTSKDYKFPIDSKPVLQQVNSPVDTQILNSFQNVNLNSKVPEELQELSQLNAYPNGPANVLNNCIYLYSEPTIEEMNQYDLVINVAKECKDLSPFFNPEKLEGKKYIHIPWNHTSSILKELPALTELIKQFDDLDSKSSNPPRKILVHCHCGVSRSACVIVAYYMCKFNLNVNDAYELLKSGTNQDSANQINKLTYTSGYQIDTCSRICPNMSLIFELMDFYEQISPE